MSEEKNLKPVKELEEELEKVSGGGGPDSDGEAYDQEVHLKCGDCGYEWVQKYCGKTVRQILAAYEAPCPMCKSTDLSRRGCD